jgi:hypothetical protein
MQRPSPDHTLLVENKLKEERESFGKEARELHKILGEPHAIATELAAEDAFTRDENREWQLSNSAWENYVFKKDMASRQRSASETQAKSIITRIIDWIRK